ncbi:MAG TPA: SPW repeat protein [Patescibacteria group bacterium]|nr:SPW repeat protein [Patescibacteria group bacterium]
MTKKREEVNSMYWLTGISGLLLMVAPYVFQYSDNQAALWTSVITGLVVVVASASEGLEKQKENWEYWVAALMGVFAIVSPFLFGFNSHATALWTTVTMGVVITFLAGSRLWLGGTPKA